MGMFEALAEKLEIPDLSDLDQENLEGSALEPELMEVPGVGEVLVGGNPFEVGELLDDHQGDNVFNFQGDCGLVTVRNFLALGGMEASEDQVVGRAIRMGQCVHSVFNRPADNGGTSVLHRQNLLESYNIPTVVLDNRSEAASLESLAALVEAGHGVNISVNAGYAWDDPNAVGDGGSNHSILVTGTAWDPETGQLKGLFVCDSGLTDRDSKAMFLSVDVLKDAYLEAPGCTALVSTNPIR